MSAKDYIRLIPQSLMHRARRTPRVARPWRTKSLTHYTSFYRNRFYEMDGWYKARIPPPRIRPTCYTIDPDLITKTLQERLQELDWEDPILHNKVDIGLPRPTRDKPTGHRTTTGNKRDADLERAARLRTLKLEPSTFDSEEDMVRNRCSVAKHFGVFEHLFHPDAYFHPRVHLDMHYSSGGEEHPVHIGNTLDAKVAVHRPVVRFEAPEDSLWTLLMVNPDGNALEENRDVVHWLVGNIRGNNVSSGEELYDYLQPLPLKGTGWHRIIFILFRQQKRIDWGHLQQHNPCNSLESRSFHTASFYKEREDDLTPAGLAFFQTEWDNSCTDCFHQRLGIPQPMYEYEWPEVHRPKQEEFPKLKPFNLYLDMYRDKQDVEKEVLQKRLKMLSPYKPMEKRFRYPNVFREELKRHMPSWQWGKMEREALGLGKFRGLYENPLT